MQILYWTVQALALFSLQYSYKHDLPQDSYISVKNGSLRSCIYKGDSAFKRGSKTYPRSEVRLLGSLLDGSYKAGISVMELAKAPHIDYSLWQLFGRGPLVMTRYREGGWQLVVFDSESKSLKIQKIPSPVLTCTIVCGHSVQCDQGLPVAGNIKCGNKLYMKIGVYAQQMKPNDTLCVTYGPMFLQKLN